MMGTEIFKIDASWAEKLTKTRVSFLTAPTVVYIWTGKYYILNTDFILHSLVCVAIDANNRNMDII